jgi:glucose-6-phosphate isomerase
MPVLLALTGFWYRQFFGSASHLIAPYHHDLQLLPSYLQQLEMESNGKRTTRDGQPLTIPSAPVIWGSAGSNGQHAYFQLLHQGTDLIPVDFIAVLKAAHPYPDQHKALLANCFAQSEALMRGKNEAEVKTELQEKNEVTFHKFDWKDTRFIELFKKEVQNRVKTDDFFLDLTQNSKHELIDGNINNPLSLKYKLGHLIKSEKTKNLKIKRVFKYVKIIFFLLLFRNVYLRL